MSGPILDTATADVAAPGTQVVADTHALLWYLLDPAALSDGARAILESAATHGRILVSTMALVELVYVAEKRVDGIDATTMEGLLDLVEAGTP